MLKAGESPDGANVLADRVSNSGSARAVGQLRTGLSGFNAGDLWWAASTPSRRPLVLQRVAHVVDCIGKIGPDADGRLEALHGLGATLLCAKRAAQIVLGVGKVRLEPHCLLEMLQGLGVAVGTCQRATWVVVRVRAHWGAVSKRVGKTRSPRPSGRRPVPAPGSISFPRAASEAASSEVSFFCRLTSWTSRIHASSAKYWKGIDFRRSPS